MKLALVLVSFAICAGTSLRVSAQDVSSEISGRSFSSNAIKRTYPGGQDDTDLTVQPKKRITKKDTGMTAEQFENEQEGDTSGSDEAGFGE